jgi:hypothetical protein
MESISSSPNRGPRGSAEVGHRCRYLGPAASTVDVMWEQMEFLVAHAGKACKPGCPECSRLEQVKRYLLQPFH